ncbi:MAG: Mannitol dehydrogenase domain protein, partial [Blastococcus sp.]|nr:Mannitol dehydrogenase domain protein [Blastococcus sp.]
AGYTFMHDVCQDPLFRRFLLDYMDREATPTLPPVPGIDLEKYKADLIGRFSNPNMRDTLARLAAESSDRIPKFLLPVLRSNLADGGDIGCSVAVLAGWARYAEGVGEDGRPIEVVDPRRDSLMAAAQRQGEEPLAFVADRELFGDLVDDERFTAAYRDTLVSLRTRGTRATLEALLNPADV